MLLKIRLVLPKQNEGVARLFHDIWHATQAALQDPRQARFRALSFFQDRVKQRSKTTLVALIDEQVTGFATWTGDTLNSLFVKPEFCGLGISEALGRRAEQEMAKTGAAQFERDCICGNTDGRRFYEHQGWRVSHFETLENEPPEGPCKTRTWRMIKP
jgi:GNAT superfamily N-acetyltransferase